LGYVWTQATLAITGTFNI